MNSPSERRFPLIPSGKADAACAPEAGTAQQGDLLAHLHQTLNAPSHPVRNRLIRLSADSPDLLAIIKEEGRV